MIYILVVVATWIHPLTHAVGIVGAARGYYFSRKAGFLVLVCYFVLAFLSLTVGVRKFYPWYYHRTVNADVQARVNKAHGDLKDVEDRVQKAYREAISGTHYVPYGDSVAVIIPLGNMLVVLGVWLLAEKEKNRKRTEPSPACDVATRAAQED